MTKLILILILLLTASVAACDSSSWRVKHEAWRESMRRYAQNIDIRTMHVDTFPAFIDTTRYYAKVDTCLTCPDGWVGPYDIEHALTGEPYGDCFRRDSHGWTVDRFPDTTYDTTWLPRVQVWLTDEQYEKLMEMLE